ncbi:hypothetical protein PHISCL_00487 [Aspergillus sclerotialis]|uniref:Uncharacterized protein n=1 Tax=Aspergillus sclerotialis TaxID=2070753 RepID=A0A3A3A611_9EURO|nr:hypothetical protein PHISCL_00487 [Aspergillus sclerotialis]
MKTMYAMGGLDSIQQTTLRNIVPAVKTAILDADPSEKTGPKAAEYHGKDLWVVQLESPGIVSKIVGKNIRVTAGRKVYKIPIQRYYTARPTYFVTDLVGPVADRTLISSSRRGCGSPCTGRISKDVSDQKGR